MKSAQQLSEKAATMPWEMLESLGVPEEKTKRPKEFNLKLVGGAFRLTNKMADRALDVVAAPARWFGSETPAPETTTETTNRAADEHHHAAIAAQPKPTPSGSATKKSQAATFNFVESAEAIYEKSISSTPLPFRKNTKDGLNALLHERFGENTEISEADMVAIIREHTPKPFLAKGMKAIKPLLSDPSLAE